MTNNKFTVKCEDITTNEEKKAEFVEAVCNALDSDYKIEPVPNVDWSDIAAAWSKELA